MGSSGFLLFGKMIVDFTSGDLSVQPPRRTACKDAHECGKANPLDTLLEEYEVPLKIKRPRIEAKDAEHPPKMRSPAVWRRKETQVPCPRCNSLATRFCYFNNYNVKQPRHFCKACQRFWTNGGSIRDLPVGSGRRKYKQKSGTKMGKVESVGGSLQESCSFLSSMAASMVLGHMVGCPYMPS